MQLILDRLKEKFGSKLLATASFRGDETALVESTVLVDVLSFLKTNLEFNMLMDVCGVDYFNSPSVSKQLGQTDYKVIQKWWNDFYPVRAGERFEVVYHLYSISKKYRIRIRTRLTEKNPTVASAFHLWRSADWFEREAYDMFGITFTGHPNLRRILTYDEFEGFPLRKDFPVNKRSPIPTPNSLLDELEQRKKEAISAMQARGK